MATRGGAGSRAKNKIRRQQEQKAIAAARKAAYAAEGRIGKRKKPRQESSSFNANKHSHITSMCGDHGCARCFPSLAGK